MSEKVNWRRKKHPSGRVGTWVQEERDKDVLPVGGLTPVPGTQRKTISTPIPKTLKPPPEEEGQIGEWVVNKLRGLGDTGWKLDRRQKEVLILLERAEGGNQLEKASSKVRLVQKYPQVYLDYKLWKETQVHEEEDSLYG